MLPLFCSENKKIMYKNKAGLRQHIQYFFCCQKSQKFCHSLWKHEGRPGAEVKKGVNIPFEAVTWINGHTDLALAHLLPQVQK